MIEHYVPLKLTHEEMSTLRDKWSRLVELHTNPPEVFTGARHEMYELEAWFGALDWLVGRIVNATETS